jgi:hypothetical protein
VDKLREVRKRLKIKYKTIKNKEFFEKPEHEHPKNISDFSRG